MAGVNPEDNPPLQARNLAQIWQRGEQDDYDELTQPFRNAESLAAAALGKCMEMSKLMYLTGLKLIIE